MPRPEPRNALERPLAHSRSAGSHGSSLIELLLAGTLLGIALLAVAPLFVRASVDLSAGDARSKAALLAHDALEARGSIEAGAAATRVEYYSIGRRRWLDRPPPPPDHVRWVRETRIVHYPLAAAADGRIEISESLAAGTPMPEVALVAVRVTVSRRAEGRAIARLERLEWSGE